MSSRVGRDSKTISPICGCNRYRICNFIKNGYHCWICLLKWKTQITSIPLLSAKIVRWNSFTCISIESKSLISSCICLIKTQFFIISTLECLREEIIICWSGWALRNRSSYTISSVVAGISPLASGESTIVTSFLNWAHRLWLILWVE